MQDTAMDDLEMDEMFDKHLEEHEAPFDDDQATGRSNAVPAHVQQRLVCRQSLKIRRFLVSLSFT